jgi:hypothetical protein
MQTVTIIRDGQIKMTLPGEVHPDGSIWARSSAGMQPVVSEAKVLAAGYTKARMAQWIKAGRLTEAAACALHMGTNPGGTEVLTPAEADARLAPQRAAEEETRKYTRTIYLSGRGWGDYSPVEWTGDVRRPDAEIIAECRAMLDRSSDLDDPQTDEQIAGKLTQARATLQAEQDAKQVADDRIVALQAEAKRTGKPQEVRRWMTDRCMNRSVDCSFDSAVETIDGNGNRKTTYTCCF